MSTEEEIKEISKKIIKLFISSKFKEVELLVNSNITPEQMEEAIAQYAQATGECLTVIPESGFRREYLGPLEGEEFYGLLSDDGKFWQSYCLPLWFDGKESDLSMEMFVNKEGDEINVELNGIYVM